MTLAEELMAVRERLALLEAGPTVIGDWHRLEARIARALVRADQQLAGRELLAELHLLRLLTQRRLLDLQACQPEA